MHIWSSSHQQQSYPNQSQSVPPRVHAQQPSDTPTTITFRFSGSKGSILSSVVTDPWGQSVFSATSTKKETIISNGARQVIATVDWDHSKPKMYYHGISCRVKDFVPYDKKSQCRTINHSGQQFDWTEASKDTLLLISKSSPDYPLAVCRSHHGTVEIEISQSALQSNLLEPILLSAFFMHSGKSLGDGPSEGLDPGVMGGIIGAQAGTFYG
ncbi:hypothetical protein HGRIS_010127 [Hohenbuehelia grisea]|uniref:DUF6593 domain-containing protein n=1 Tax=Hohenbuehelia grisea TaxID=104357 RepID=A0ABR3J3A9_9AGAR